MDADKGVLNIKENSFGKTVKRRRAGKRGGRGKKKKGPSSLESGRPRIRRRFLKKFLGHVGGKNTSGLIGRERGPPCGENTL